MNESAEKEMQRVIAELIAKRKNPVPVEPVKIDSQEVREKIDQLVAERHKKAGEAVEKLSQKRVLKDKIRQEIRGQIKVLDAQTSYRLEMPDERPFKYWEVIVQRPCIRTVFVRSLLGKNKEYRLSLPWVVFIRSGEHGPPKVVFCLNEPKDLDVPVYFPPLSNIFDNLHVCTGSSPARINKSFEEWINGFWESRFIDDGPSRGGMVRKLYLISWSMWHWRSRFDKNYGRKMKLPRIKRLGQRMTLRDVGSSKAISYSCNLGLIQYPMIVITFAWALLTLPFWYEGQLGD